MQVNQKEARELLETLAFQEASESALHGKQHASRIARLPVDSWQAEIIRQSSDIVIAESAESLRAAMQKTGNCRDISATNGHGDRRNYRTHMC